MTWAQYSSSAHSDLLLHPHRHKSSLLRDRVRYRSDPQDGTVLSSCPIKAQHPDRPTAYLHKGCLLAEWLGCFRLRGLCPRTVHTVLPLPSLCCDTRRDGGAWTTHHTCSAHPGLSTLSSASFPPLHSAVSSISKTLFVRPEPVTQTVLGFLSLAPPHPCLRVCACVHTCACMHVKVWSQSQGSFLKSYESSCAPSLARGSSIPFG